MENYNPKEIEAKWQVKWLETGLYKNYSRDKKFYVLDMFPYPSGAGLHVGHPKGFIATDVTARLKMMQGYSVLHPMGWDAFGLPAENYAIKNKSNPNIFTAQSVARYKKQLEMFGLTYDWDKEINTTDPDYYRWTQWIFLKMFEKGLAFESDEPVNWCPTCKTGLANEDLEGGLCERCGTQVVQKKLRQWVLRMTDYADRLLYDLDSKELNWEDMIKEQQKNWIGRSEGVQFAMDIIGTKEKIEVYTTRVDTVFGMTYAVVAPEHPIIEKLKGQISNYAEIERYIIESQNKTTLERTELQKEKTGIRLECIEVVNPFTKKAVPLFVADYVLGGYGTGAVMAVPAHDERDFEFAKKYKLEIIKSISSSSSFAEDECFVYDGVLVDSENYSGLSSEEAREKMTQWLEKEGIGKRKVNYKMRDWVFSRQRYWGEPIPIVHCEKCGAVGVSEDQLPVRLPDVEQYEPTGTGESPLAAITDWVNTTCPKCAGPGKRETNTMPQWAGSSWYYLRYIDAKNNEVLVDKKLEKEWMPVDLYVGGAEHATRHLLYARFWHKFLFDIGVVSTQEPFKKLMHVGLILASDGRKMSKRWGNVVNPDDIIAQFGADSLRLYEMFMGPFSQEVSWSTDGVKGVRRFLDRIWKLESNLVEIENKNTKNLIHKTIKKVTEDIDAFRFNTAVSAMMILINDVEKNGIAKTDYETLLQILAPFAPHIAEEIWNKLGHAESIFLSTWPQYDPELIKDEKINLVIQVNGKVRDMITISADLTEDEAKKVAMESEKIKAHIVGKEIRKIIYVKNKLVSIVT